MQKALRVGIININTNKPKYSSLEKTLKILENIDKEDLDIVVGPEWSLMSNQLYEKPYSSKGLEQLLSKLKEISSYSNALMIPGTAVVRTKADKMYNLLPVFYHGKNIFATIKKADGGTSFFNNDGYELIGGDHTIENTFNWNGLKIGIEICADSKRLVKEGKTDLDIQILSSSGIRLTDLAINKNGYLICSDGYPSKGKKTYILKIKDRKKTDAGDIDLYEYQEAFQHKIYPLDKNAPFEFVMPAKSGKNLNVYYTEI